MKVDAQISNFAKNISLTFVLGLLCFGLHAQNIWRGGTPGAETEWANPRNWSMNQVPDWTDFAVIIPDVSSRSRFFPVIRNRIPEISYLVIEAGARLTVEATGVLTINGEHTYNHGILNTGHLYNSGQMTIVNTALAPLDDSSNTIHNTGKMDIHPPLEKDTIPLAATSLKL